MGYISRLKVRGVRVPGDIERVVIHPLDDLREEKIDISKLGRMQMKLAAKVSLLALRIYLFLMVLLVIYHVMDLAGLFGGGPAR